MANLARTYHDELQRDGLPQQTHQEVNFHQVLNKIPIPQTLANPENSILNQVLTEGQTEKALHLSKNGSATGLDGCPYEPLESPEKAI
jgi:hypothetical protein